MPEKKSLDTEDFEQSTLDAHRLLVMWLFICTVGVALPFFALLIVFNATGHGGLTILIPVVVAGAGGAFVSSLRRLYSFQDIFPRREYIQLFRKLNFYVIAYSLVPAVVGIISALILYLLFAAGLLKGALFPDFFCSLGENKCTDFYSFVSSWMPNGPTENAKAIVWAFIAGFSERFVPDILNRMASRTDQGENRSVDPTV